MIDTFFPPTRYLQPVRRFAVFVGDAEHVLLSARDQQLCQQNDDGEQQQYVAAKLVQTQYNGKRSPRTTYHIDHSIVCRYSLSPLRLRHFKGPFPYY